MGKGFFAGAFQKRAAESRSDCERAQRQSASGYAAFLVERQKGDGGVGRDESRPRRNSWRRGRPKRAMGAPCPDGAGRLWDAPSSARLAHGQREPRKNARRGQNRGGRWERRVLTECGWLWDVPSSARLAQEQREPRKNARCGQNRSGRWERRVLTECVRLWECSVIGAAGARAARTAQKRPLRIKPRRAMGCYALMSM